MVIKTFGLFLFMISSLQAQYRSSDDKDEESFYESEEVPQNSITINTRNHPQHHPASASSEFLEERVSSLEEQVRKLRGSLEETQHLLKNKRVIQTDDRKDQKTADENNSVFTDLESDNSSDQDSPLNDRPAFRQYEEAQHLLSQENFSEAERVLKDILKHYPNDSLIINVHYWLGEIYYTQKNYTKAAVAFGDTYKAYRLLDKTANDDQKNARKMGFAKAPEALVKLALSFKALGQSNQACVTLDQLRSEFPQLPDNVKRLAETAEQELSCKNVQLPKK